MTYFGTLRMPPPDRFYGRGCVLRSPSVPSDHPSPACGEDEEEIERLVLAYSSRWQRLGTTGRSPLNASRETVAETGGVDHEAFWEDVEG